MLGHSFSPWSVGSGAEMTWHKGLAEESYLYHSGHKKKKSREWEYTLPGLTFSEPTPTSLYLLTVSQLQCSHDPLTFQKPPIWMHEALGVITDQNHHSEEAFKVLEEMVDFVSHGLA